MYKKMNEEVLTDFQVKCEIQLTNSIAVIGKSISGREVAGINEKYINGNIDDLEFWIYEDGADFKTPDYCSHFEKPDYDSLEDLSAHFISKIIEKIQNF